MPRLRDAAPWPAFDEVSVSGLAAAFGAPNRLVTTHRELIAREILATSFEFGEPGDGSDIGEGVQVAIAKVN